MIGDDCVSNRFRFIGVREDGRLPAPVCLAACLSAFAVCLSTLTTRQHVLADVFGGVFLAEAAWRLAGFRLFQEWYSRLVQKTIFRV